jgi:hypothetical protein
VSFRVAADLALASRCEGHVDEAVGVGKALLRAALRSLLLLLGLDLRGLRLDFALIIVSTLCVAWRRCYKQRGRGSRGLFP